MAHIISLCNQKGGVGKTTTAVNISAYLAAFGKRVLLVDLDPQGNASSAFVKDKNQLGKTVYDALVHGDDPFDVVKKTRFSNIDILPANSSLAGATIELVGKKNREFLLDELLKKVKKRYDYIIIDLPPSLGLFMINALAASDRVIVPIQCEYYALEGLAELLRTMGLVKKNLKVKNQIMGALLTMYDKTSPLNRAVSKEIHRNFPGYVFQAVIPRNIKLAEAPSFGMSVLHHSPYSHGAKAYRKLTEEIIEILEGHLVKKPALTA